MRVRGIAAWADGLPDWDAMRAVARGEGVFVADAPRRPSPDLLPANERRRAPDSVLLALHVAQGACASANVDPASLPSVFASTHGDLAISDYMCQTLAQTPRDISPTKFHNSVHNAAAGYWTIGCRCHAGATAISAYQATFAQGLLEAALQLAGGADTVLLVAYDGPSWGPLARVSRSTGLLGLGLVLSHDTDGAGVRLCATLESTATPVPRPESRWQQLAGNAMAPALVLVEALANRQRGCVLDAGPELSLALTLDHHE